MPWAQHPLLPREEDLLDLAGALAALARAARETRTTLWSALQATQLVDLDREVATGLRKLDEVEQVKVDDTATNEDKAPGTDHETNMENDQNENGI